MVRARGAYLLVLKNEGDESIRVGRRDIYFYEGYYIYCGSAMNGLAKRIERHFLREKKLRWNIDYISARMQPIKAFGILSNEKIECWLSKELSAIFDAFDNFGASDCRCETHLYYSRTTPLRKIEEFLRRRLLNYLEFRVR
jgi:sugar fermentation stimulation protein A